MTTEANKRIKRIPNKVIKGKNKKIKKMSRIKKKILTLIRTVICHYS